MYAKLFQNMSSSPALTNSTKFPCPSLPIPGPNFSLYEDEPVIHNREYYQAPMSSPSSPIPVPTTTPVPPRPPVPPLRTPLSSLLGSSPMVIPSHHPLAATPTGTPTEHLLPVLDCRFNLREICKQCILLEDHLSHDKKRCTDCCIKHFLALEGLCEEAVTLDNEEAHKEIRGLAEKIRVIQKMWYDDPVGNSHQCSQELRKIRKEFMMEVFPMIFEEKGSCGNGVCTLSFSRNKM